MKLSLNNKRVLVLGLGETGLSAVRWLADQGALLTVADTRENPPGLDLLKAELPHVKVHTGAFKADVFNEAEMIVASPGVPLSTPEIQSVIARGVPVVGDVELFAQHISPAVKVIAITGANGKTTVTSLVGEMCKVAGLNTVVAGNIGLPVLDIFRMDTPDVVVLELSSFQLEITNSLKVDAATVLNVTEDHMDRYASFADYAAAKARIFNHAKVKVINREDAYSLAMGSAMMADTISAKISFGLNAPVNQQDFGLLTQTGVTYLAQGSRALLPLKEMKLKGLHNAANALAALALCRAIGLYFAPLLNTLKTFKGLPHRVEWVANINDVDFYDDSKGTNVGATCAAIAGMSKNSAIGENAVGENISQKVVLIAGGDGKGQDFSPLLSVVEGNARAVVLIGRDAPVIEQALMSSDIPRYLAVDLPEAVNIAYKVAQPGDTVLLSPACASFDMFKNYVHRAEVFIAAVMSLQSHTQKAGASR